MLESGIDATNGSSAGFTRQSTFGLVQNGIGSMDVGRRLSPGSIAFVGIDPFNTNFSQASLDSSMGATNIRYSNMLALATEDFNGFQFMAGYSFETGLKAADSPVQAGAFGTSNKFRAVSITVRYSSGPVLQTAMFDTYLSPSSKNSSSIKQWNVVGVYDFKVVKLHAAFGQNIDGRISGTNTLGNVETTGGDANTRGAVLFAPGARTNQWMVGLSAAAGPQGKLFASIEQMRPGGDFTIGARTSQTISSVGYSYQFSKRTGAYIYYSYISAVPTLKHQDSVSR